MLSSHRAAYLAAVACSAHKAWVIVRGMDTELCPKTSTRSMDPRITIAGMDGFRRAQRALYGPDSDAIGRPIWPS